MTNRCRPNCKLAHQMRKTNSRTAIAILYIVVPKSDNQRQACRPSKSRTSISNAKSALNTLDKLPQALHPVLIDRHSTSMHKRHQHGSRTRTQIGLSTSTDQKPADKMLKSITRSLRRAISNAPCRTPASQECMASLHRRPASQTCLTNIFAPLPL